MTQNAPQQSPTSQRPGQPGTDACAPLSLLPMPPAPHPRVRWAFTCRRGGFSQGPWGAAGDTPPHAGPLAEAAGEHASASASLSRTRQAGIPADTHTPAGGPHSPGDPGSPGSLDRPNDPDESARAARPAPDHSSCGLNLGAHCGDDPAHVARNRQLLADAIGHPIRWLRQVHGTQVSVAGTPAGSAPPAARHRDDLLDTRPAEADPDSQPPRCTDAHASRHEPQASPEADAQVSNQPGLAIAVLVADCLPVLLADRQGRVVGAAHAGWRGLLDGVIEATVQRMRQTLGPGTPADGATPSEADIVAWLGPCIGPTAFEVGAEVREAFIRRDARAESAFVPAAKAGKWLANLPLLARQRLATLGITDIHGADACTFSQPERFWSYRRDHTCGRMAALVWLEG